MSAFIVSVETIDAIVSGARQYGGGQGISFARVFRDTERGYTHHRFSRYAADTEAPETFNPNTIGRELWSENVRSIHARYPDTVEGTGHPGPLGFTEAEAIAYVYGPGARVAEVDPLGLLGAIRGYEYQACEHDAWPDSIAHAFCRALESAVVDYLIEAAGANVWTVDDLNELTGTLQVTPTETGWTMRFVRGRSEAVSLLEAMSR